MCLSVLISVFMNTDMNTRGMAWTIRTLAAYWCVSPDFVRKQIAKGDLKIFRKGRVIRIRYEDGLKMLTPSN